MYAFLPDNCCAAFCKKWEEDTLIPSAEKGSDSESLTIMNI
jgi:hypothetical protein